MKAKYIGTPINQVLRKQVTKKILFTNGKLLRTTIRLEVKISKTQPLI